MSFDNTNRGVLFKNKNKSDPKHPDYTGNLNVDGEEFWLSGWVKTAGPSAREPGSKFLSVSVTLKDAPAIPASGTTDFDDDIPF